MKQTNNFRLLGFLVLTSNLLMTGCSDAPKAPLGIDYQAPVSVSNNDRFTYRDPSHQPKRFKTGETDSDTVWSRLLSLYALPDEKNPRIDRELKWYISHPVALAIIQQRAEPYLHHILDEVEARNIPGELALLPVVESAFVPDAYSKADASGLWQFVPATGKEYGLKQNSWYDGRRDIYASTIAATMYLKELSEAFDGDWLLALASYNCGQGRVKKSIEKNQYLSRPTDYWSLDLPGETENYVPRLLAVAKLFANADEYHIHLQHIPNRPYFEVVDIKSPIDLDKAAQLANTPLPAFLKLNPGFNRASTSPEGPHRLLVPINQAEEFKRNLAMLPYSERLDSRQYNEDKYADAHSHARREEKSASQHDDGIKTALASYKVKRNDSLTSIAQKNNTTAQLLREANHLTTKTAIYSGMKLQVPLRVETRLAVTAKNKAVDAQSYIIKKGDTFYNISQRFSIGTKDIADWNNITLKTALIPGKKLTIKSHNSQFASAANTKAVNTKAVSYTIGKGDSLAVIAKKFNVSVADLKKSNAETLNKGIVPGKKVKLIIESRAITS